MIFVKNAPHKYLGRTGEKLCRRLKPDVRGDDVVNLSEDEGGVRHLKIYMMINELLIINN